MSTEPYEGEQGHHPASAGARRGLPGALPEHEAQRRLYARIGGCFVALLLMLAVTAYVMNQARLTTTQQIHEARIDELQGERDTLRKRLAKLDAQPALVVAPTEEVAFAFAIHLVEEPRRHVWLTARRDCELWVGFDEEETGEGGVWVPLATGERVSVTVPRDAPPPVRVWLTRVSPDGSWQSDSLQVPGAAAESSEQGEAPAIGVAAPAADAEPAFVYAGLATPVRLRLPLGDGAPALTLLVAHPGEATNARTAESLPVLYPLGRE